MDFSDNPSTPQVKDSLPKEHWRRNNGFSWQIPCGETSFQFRCRIVEHGITIAQKESDFNHPYPMFTRVFLFRKGGAEIICRNQRRTLVENRIYILPANMVFQIHYYPRELIYYHLCLNDGYDQPIFDREESVQEIVSDPVRGQLLRAQREKSEIFHHAALLSLFAEFLPQRQEQIFRNFQRHLEFSALFEYLDTHPLALVSLSDLAGLYGLSDSTFSKRFSRKMGISLKRFLLERQIRYACELLLYSPKRVGEIAEILGYRDITYFYRFFRKQTGMTPQEFRKNKTMESRIEPLA